MQPTLEDLRELSRRSLRAQNAGLAAALAALLVTPLVLLVGVSTWSLVPAFLAAGAVFVHFAWRAGEARGAFRRVFKRVKDEQRAARRVEIEAAPDAARVGAQR